MKFIYHLCGPFVLMLAVTATSAQAEIVTYTVEFQDSMGNSLDGPVTVGTEVFWAITATVSDSDAGNFGIAAASVDLQDDMGETLNPGTVQTGVGEDFEGYTFPSGGAFVGGTLQGISTFTSPQGATTVGVDHDNGGNLDPLVLATGSYTVTTVGLHTLSTLNTSGGISRYYTAAGQTLGSSTAFETVNFGSDTLQVVPVPEPPTLAMMGLACLGAWGTRRRKPSLQPTA